MLQVLPYDMIEIAGYGLREVWTETTNEDEMEAIVRFRGDKLYNEHIYWDQASVLAQIGLLDPATLPVAGVETARKLLDESLPSNTKMRRWSESAGR